MSLAVLADHMASRGRGPDSMLIHMSPREVQGLQALAENYGGSLTINPETGLPEAGFLDKLLPTIIGVGLSMAGVPPHVAAMIVGGAETVRTGDLGKGISAGLGAYGGAGLGAGMGTAGAEAIGSQAAGQSYLSSYVPPGVLEGAGAGLSADMAYNLGQAGVVDAASTQAVSAAQQAAAERIAAATPFDKISAGFDAAKANPSSLLTKDNFKYLAAAAAPILADQAVKSNLPTTTTRPGMITPYNYFGGQYVAGNPYQATPTRSAGGGLMGMDDGGYSPGQLDFTQRSEPVVRMAEGGMPGYAAGGYKPTDTEIFDYFKTSGLSDAKIAQDMQTFGVSAADIARATGTQGQQTDYEKRFVNTLIAPTTDASEFMAATKSVGLQDQALANAMNSAGLSAAGQYALTHNLSDASGVTGTDFYSNLGYTTGALPGDQGGLEGLYANINYTAKSLQDQINAGTLTVGKAQDLALAEANRAGVSLGDISGATGKTIGTLFTEKVDEKPVTCGPGFKLNAARTACEPIVCGPGLKLNAAGTACEAVAKVDDTTDDKVVIGDLVCGPGYKKSIDGKTCVLDTTIVTEETTCPTGQHRDAATGKCVPNISTTQNTTDTVDKSTSLVTADASTLPVGVSGNTGASIIGGGSTVNPNGTITTSPVIPGIPVGGFTGMTSLRKAYEDGGGSLGVNKDIFVPKTYKELEDRFKLTGGSKQAMDYLTGKTKYTPIPYTEDGQIAKPYAESVMKMPVASSSKMYIFKNGRYEVNPEYAIPTYDKDGKKSSNLTNADVKTFMDKGPSTDAFYTWATTNNLSPEQVAMASGRPINEISKLFTGAKELTDEEGKIDQTKVDEKTAADEKTNFDADAYLKANQDVMGELTAGKANFGTKADLAAAAWEHYQRYGKPEGRKYTKKAAGGGLMAMGGGLGSLGSYSDGGRLLRGPGDGVSDSIPATIGNKRPARLADGEFVVPARIVSELGNGSTEAGARKLYAMMDRVQRARRGTVGKGRVAKNSRSDKYLPA